MVLWIVTALILLFLVVPVAIIIPMSFSSSQYLEFPPPGFSMQWYEAFFSSPQWTGALKTSLEVGAITTVFALILGTLAAYALANSNFKGKALVTELFMTPMMVPAIIVGLAIYRFESQVHLSGSFMGLVIAHIILAIPFVIKTVLASLVGINPNLELAAQNLGANKLQAFVKVILPIIKPAIFSGGMFAFATSFDEIVVTQFISGVKVTTLTKLMWDGLKQQLDPTITAIAAIMIVGITILMVVVNSKDIFYKEVQVKEEIVDED